ncbi:MAG: 23S rRNA (uracil(1939)-C(5))-methyltransferase RlmD [Alphaproteobacteria bacterium]
MRRGGPRGRKAAPDPALGQRVDIEIERIGRSGDGIASHEEKPVYVPLALPGDLLSVRLTKRRGEGYAAEVIESRSLMPRRQPACRHFGQCGGCRLQHLPMASYRDWKRDQVIAALKSRAIEGVDIRPLIDAEPGSRRRIRLAFQRAGDRVSLGYRQRERQEIVDVGECPIALPAITALFEPLRHLLARIDMAEAGGEVAITAADSGLDLLVETRAEPTLADREGLAALAEREDLARIAWRPDARSEPEPIAARRAVSVQFGDVPAALPPGAFLQATEAAERAIIKAVAAAIGEARRVTDLFAGCGTIGLPLARRGHKVLAVEREPAMVQTLDAAARSAGLAADVRTMIRDLDQTPLGSDELADTDAVVLDPPRAGAASQIAAIVQGRGPKTLAMVSCNPATFARDARALLDAGYRLAWVQPIDAFLYAAEIELVAAFHR